VDVWRKERSSRVGIVKQRKAAPAFLAADFHEKLDATEDANVTSFTGLANPWFRHLSALLFDCQSAG
jgi:hypothetical protein